MSLGPRRGVEDLCAVQSLPRWALKRPVGYATARLPASRLLNDTLIYLNSNLMLTVEQRLQRLEDEAAIRDLVARFADTTTREDYAGFAALWAPNATFAINKPFVNSATGTEAILAMLHKLRDGRDFFVQFVNSGVIELLENQATARWILHEAAKSPGEHYYTPYGIFFDELEKVDGQWLFTRRSFEYLFLNLGPFTGDAHELLTKVDGAA